MNPGMVEVQGSLLADGSLVLDEKPNLPAGRVRIVLQPLPPAPPADSFWQSMQAIWDAQKAGGRAPRTREAIDAELQALDEDADAEMQAIERLQQECRPPREGQPPEPDRPA